MTPNEQTSSVKTLPLTATDALIQRVHENEGFLSIRQFMDFCLSDPDHGYYR